MKAFFDRCLPHCFWPTEAVTLTLSLSRFKWKPTFWCRRKSVVLKTDIRLWKNKQSVSGELRKGALQIWRGVVCFSGDFTFRINILNSISTPHKHSFFIITNVLSVSRDLPHPFLTFYFNPNLHHFINNTCNLIHFLSMTIDTKLMELIGVFLNYVRFVNYNVSC